MSPEQIFPVVNAIALASWILLAALPGRQWVTRVVTVGVPVVLAVLYTVVVALVFAHGGGGFSTLDAVAVLFTNRWALLAGWVHYLAFDLLCGSWEAEDARRRGIPHWIVLPCLLLTFLFGPAGWLLYRSLRLFRAFPLGIRRPAASTATD